MKSRALRLAAALAVVIIFTNALSFTTKSNRYAESYPAVVCAPNLAGQTSAISVASSKTQVRKTGISTLKYQDARNRRLAGSSQATVIDGKDATPIAWQVQTGTWAGGLTCIAPVTTQWFVGATADVTSKGTLTLVNSGLGRAIVGVTVFTENGIQAEKLFAIKANAFTSVALASLAPGSQSIAIYVKPQTGRVNAFLADERGRGLRALGGDTVNSVESAAKKIVIPAIPHQSIGKSSLGHTLRVLVPGEVGTQLSVEIVSADGRFSPAGVDGRNVPAGKVIDIPLNLIMKSGAFALHISSERPLVAAVFSKTTALGKSDFLWSTSVPELVPSAYSVSGLAPNLVFTGEEISVDLDLLTIKGVHKKVEIRGSEIETYRVSDKIRTVTILKSSQKTFAAALINSKSGSGYAPLLPGSALTRTSIPRSNIRVLIP